MSAGTDDRCPVPGGQFGEDTGLWKLCPHCALKERCRRAARQRAKQYKDTLAEELRHPMRWNQEFVSIPLGLRGRGLDHTDQFILAQLLYTYVPEKGRSFPSHGQLALLCDIDKTVLSKRLNGRNRNTGLIERGYVERIGDRYRPTLLSFRLEAMYREKRETKNRQRKLEPIDDR